MKTLIKNGRLIDPANKIDGKLDILIENGNVLEVSTNINNADNIIDATNLWVTPGLIDMHVHLRDPGGLHKETIKTGAKSAAAGGFTTICCMPNTNPVVDNAKTVEYITSKAAQESIVNIIPIGSITRGLMGEELSDIKAMKNVGIKAISDDGKTVDNPALFRKAMEIATSLNLPVLSHCEDLRLVGKGLIHEGNHAKKLNLKGIPAEAEEIIIARDITLARLTGAKLHICHVSTAEGVALIKKAQANGQPITAEVCPHHFTLIDEDMTTADANYKMSPPLRCHAHRKALLDGLKDGTISVIATDHAPHHEDEKNANFNTAPNGIIGLETALPLCIELIEQNILTPPKLIATLTINPAQIMGINKGHLSPNSTADITIIDPKASYNINKNTFHSLSRNTPFNGRKVTGRVMYTIVAGEIIYKGENI